VDRVTTMTTPVARAGFTTTITEPQVEMVGFEWHGPPAATFEVRARHGGRWTGWTEVESQPSDGPDARSREHTNSTAAGPVWVGTGVTRVQVNVVEGELRGLRVHALHTTRPASRRLAATPAGADPDRP